MMRCHLAAAIAAGLLLSPISSFAQFQIRQTPEEQACGVYLAERFNDRTVDKYNPSIVEETKVNAMYYGLQKQQGIFGGHKYLVGTYSLDTLKAGAIVNSSHAESGYCVFGDDSQVMGFEDSLDQN
jgi:hypothetical protein